MSSVDSYERHTEKSSLLAEGYVLPLHVSRINRKVHKVANENNGNGSEHKTDH